MSDLTVRHAGASTRCDVDLTTRARPASSFPNPVFTASGCAAAGRELDAVLRRRAIGGVVTKSIMLAPRSGRADPADGRDAERHAQLHRPAGPGHRRVPRAATSPGCAAARRPRRRVDRRRQRRRVRRAGAASCAAAPGVAAVEVNISCPNVEDRGQVFACDAGAAADVIDAVRAQHASGVPVFAKLSPDVTDIVDDRPRLRRRRRRRPVGHQHAARHGHRHRRRMRPVLGGVTGGLSGPAIRPVAVRCVWQVHAPCPTCRSSAWAASAPASTRSSSCSPGASAVSVGTAVFDDPSRARRGSCASCEQALADRGFDRLADVVGLAHRPPERVRPGATPATPVGRRSPLAEETARRPRSPSPWTPPTSRPPPRWAQAVTPHVAAVKVGLELFCATGPTIVESVRGAAGGRRVFLDLKLHDIPNTVAGAARSVARLQPRYLTVHAAGGAAMIARGRRGARPTRRSPRSRC